MHTRQSPAKAGDCGYAKPLGTSKKKKMSRQGLKIAVKIGLSRRKFLNEESAKKYFNSLRKEVFELVEKLKIEYPNHKLDYSPESLKLIENIYFDYYDKNKFSEETISKDEFEILLAIYDGNVYVTNGKANWIVEEDAFVRDNRFYLAIKSLNGFLTIDCTKWGNHERRPSNKRRQLIYREYKKNEQFCVDKK